MKRKLLSLVLLLALCVPWALGQTAIPYTMDFESESSAPVSGWANTGTGSQVIDTSSSHAHGGTKSLKFKNGTSNIAIMPVFTSEISGLELSVWWKPEGIFPYCADFDFGYITNATDASTFVTVKTVNYADYGNVYHQETLYFPSAPNGARIAFRARPTVGGYYWFIDDITVGTIPTCYPPTSLTSSNITSSGATISWTASGHGETNYQYICQTSTTAAPTESEWTSATLVQNATTCSPTGLNPNTSYDIYVRSYCSATDQSSAVKYTFKTPCNAVTITSASPFNEDFNDLTSGIPDCWDNSEGTTTTESYKWNYYSTGNTGACVRFDSYNNSPGLTNMLKTPVLSLPANPATLSFYYKNPSDSSDLSVYISTDGGSTYSTSLITGLKGLSSWTLVEIPLNSYVNQNNVVIVFKGTSDCGWDNIYLDDVKVEAPACAKPTDLAATNITASSVDLSWTAGGFETAWNMQYSTNNTTWTPVSGTITNPYTLTGLTANTPYYVQVQADCGGEQSEWTSSVSFTTPCAVIATADLPYTEGFESYLGTTYDNIGEIPNCWDSYADCAIKPHVIESGNYYYVHNGWKALTFYGNGNCYAVLPVFENALNELKISFWSAMQSSSHGTLTLGYITSADVDMNTFTSIQNVTSSHQTMANTEVMLNNLPSNAYRLVFRWYDSSLYTCCIDDIEVSVSPSCMEPTGINVPGNTISTDQAIVTWTAGGDETDWNVRYKEGSTGSWSASIPISTNPTCTLTSLNPNTKYYVQVQADCGSGDTSYWTSSVSFSTSCYAFVLSETNPYTQDFEVTTSMPDCWRSDHYDGSTSYNWQVSSSEKHQGSMSLKLPDMQPGNKTLAVLQQMYVPTANDYMVDLWYYRTSLTYGSGNTEAIRVLVNTTPTATGATELLYVNHKIGEAPVVSSAGWYQYESAVIPMSGNVYIMIDGISGDCTSSFIDDVSVHKKPSCAKPTDLDATNITTTTADISWTAGGTEDTWNLQYKLSSDDSWTSVNGLTTTSYHLTNLTGGKSYNVQVQADCGGGDESEWRTNLTFTTACPASVSVPYTEDFEGMTVSTVPTCWDNSESTTPTLSSSPEYVWGVYEYSSNKMIRMYNYFIDDDGDALINTPAIALPANNPCQLAFKYAHNASSGDFIVKISTDNGVSFTDIAAYSKGSSSDRYDPGTFTNAIINLSSYKGQTVILQFWNQPDYDSGAIFVDDISVTEVNTFTGDEDNDWTVSANWSKGSVPTAGQAVIINANCSIPDAADAVCDAMTINYPLYVAPTASLVAASIDNTDAANLVIGSDEDGTGTVKFTSGTAPKATVEMYFKGHATWYPSESRYMDPQWEYRGFIGTPDPAQTLSYIKVLKWNETLNGSNCWEYFAENSSADYSAKTGYSMANYNCSTAVTRTYTTTLTAVGDITYTGLTKTETGTGSSTSNNCGVNMITNSMSAPIDLSVAGFDLDDLSEQTFYFFSTRSYNDSKSNPTAAIVTYPYNSGSAIVSSMVPAGQSFAVKAASNNVSITIPEAAISSNESGPMYAPAENSEFGILAITAESEDGVDELYLLESNLCDENFNNGYDGTKMFASNAPQIYASNDYGMTAVNADNTLLGQYIGVRQGSTSNSITLTICRRGLENYRDLKLYDCLSVAYYDLDDDETTITVTATGDQPRRFLIAGKRDDGPEFTPTESGKFVIAGDQLMLENFGRTDVQIMLTDASGKILWSESSRNGTTFTLPQLPAGVYFISCGKVSAKFITK